MRHATNLLSSQVAPLQTLVLWAQLQMRDVLGCRTVLNSHVVLCATVVSFLGHLLPMSATPLIIWKAPGSESVRVMGTGVALFHSVLRVSHVCVHVLITVDTTCSKLLHGHTQLLGCSYLRRFVALISYYMYMHMVIHTCFP